VPCAIQEGIYQLVQPHQPSESTSQRIQASQILVLQEENEGPKQRRETFLGTVRKNLEVVEQSHPLSQEDEDAALDMADVSMEYLDYLPVALLRGRELLLTKRH
jgi:hypothetical protein